MPAVFPMNSTLAQSKYDLSSLNVHHFLYFVYLNYDTADSLKQICRYYIPNNYIAYYNHGHNNFAIYEF